MRSFHEFTRNICLLRKYISKGEKSHKKGNTFKKKTFLSTSTDISSVYFKKSDLDLKATS